MSTITAPIATLSVNEVLRQFPATIAVFSRHGIDACCGGSASVNEAAARHGIDPAALLDQLQQVTGAERVLPVAPAAANLTSGAACCCVPGQ